MIASLDKLNFDDDTKGGTVHSLPCKIHYNGGAKINEYFSPSASNERELNVSFRGFPLNGKVLNVPESYHGFIFHAARRGNLVPIRKFASLTHWEWDKNPTENDAFISALDWLALSSQVHDPVEDD